MLQVLFKCSKRNCGIFTLLQILIALMSLISYLKFKNSFKYHIVNNVLPYSSVGKSIY